MDRVLPTPDVRTMPFRSVWLRQYADVLRLSSGASLTVRFVEPDDLEPLRAYFGRLSNGAHHSRFLGAIRELPQAEVAQMLHPGQGGHFAVIAQIGSGSGAEIVGEARYALDPAAGSVEFAISVGDDWQGCGAGFALLSNLECRAAALGADTIVGDALATNQRMRRLALRRGYSFSRTPGDWTLVRFTRNVRLAHDIPCLASSRAAGGLAPMAG